MPTNDTPRGSHTLTALLVALGLALVALGLFGVTP